MLPWRKPITIRASLIRSFVILILVSSLSVLILMSIRAYQTEQELSEKLINNGTRQVAQELNRFFQPANRGALMAAFWGRSGKLNLNEVIAGRPGKVTEAQRQAATRLNTLLLPLLLQVSEISSVQIATARGDGFLILQLPSGHIRNRVVNRENWGTLPRLWDFSDADLSGLNYEILQEFISAIEPDLQKRDCTKVALLCDTNDAFPYLRMFESIIDGKNSNEIYATFQSKEDALDWLVEK